MSRSDRQDQVSLPYPLDEFRSALEAELEAASREAASRAVPLVNGKRIAQVGSAFQYVFHLESSLLVPDDSPGELHVDGHPPESATIISTEGSVVTLSVEVDLGPSVPRASIRSDLTFLLRRLIERVEMYATKPNPAGGRILAIRAPSGDPDEGLFFQFDSDLNEQQKAAVRSSLGRDMTFLWGPPGTGKTKTIGRIGAELFSRGRSLLLVSHTNIAVDQALLKAAEELSSGEHKEEIAAGKVLRVGTPRDERFGKHPDLLLSEQVRRRSQELATREGELKELRAELIVGVVADQNVLDIAEWVSHAEQDLRRHRERLQQLAILDRQVQSEEEMVCQAQDRTGHLDGDASTARELNDRIGDLVNRMRRMKSAGHAEVQRLGDRRDLLAKQLKALELEIAAREEELGAQQRTLDQTRKHGSIMRLWKGLPKPEDQQRRVGGLSEQVDQARDHAEKLSRTVDGLRQQINEVERQLEEVDAATRTLMALQDQAFQAEPKVVTKSRHPQPDFDPQGVLVDYSKLEVELRDFSNRTTMEPVQLLRDHRAATETLRNCQQRLTEVRGERSRLRRDLAELLAAQFKALRQANLLPGPASVPVDPSLQVNLLADLHAQEAEKLVGVDLAMVKARVNSTNTRIAGVDQELADIADALTRVETDLVAAAVLVATTLTGAYLRDFIQERSFDTVLLDEASMAPIPALWVAAGVASRNVVIVGDPKQLPPIKHSTDKMAEKWLGRDIFEVAGVMDSSGAKAGHLVQLKTQYRMHPHISAIANLIYKGDLQDGQDVSDAKSDEELAAFYDPQWGVDEPVALLDTGPLDAWVTTVDRGSSTSRLNFLSAVICADLAEQLLRDGRPPLSKGDRARILIVTPYRPQANLIDLLISQQDLQDDVKVGTAHSFQGSEGSIVIFDLVVDEPHWRVGLFNPQYDSTNTRLLNVALTRARRRLIIVGDFDYVASKGKNAFVGRCLVPHLFQHHRRVPAHEVLPVGLSARTASAQSETTGGPLESEHDRLLADSSTYYRYLASDLAGASRRVIIYSPFMTPKRISVLEPHLRDLSNRGVAAYVITKPLRERPREHQASSGKIERHLRTCGVKILHKRAMHEKVVIIDDAISWVGSLNTLSFAGTGEIMERRRSERVVRDYVKHLRIEELIASLDAEETLCPVCRDDLETAEGKWGPYWRCHNNCHSRPLDQPYPRRGKLPCGSCGADVEFGYWGGDPHWRCLRNRMHRQRLRPQHLNLPLMRELIPKTELRKLKAVWNLKLDG